MLFSYVYRGTNGQLSLRAFLPPFTSGKQNSYRVGGRTFELEMLVDGNITESIVFYLAGKTDGYLLTATEYCDLGSDFSSFCPDLLNNFA